MTERDRELLEALVGLLAKMQHVENHEKYKRVWEVAQLQEGKYSGPKWDREVRQAIEVLKKYP